ncbi:MAG: 3-oxo-tetronate kinase [Beutenbergiaceae bacterium]
MLGVIADDATGATDVAAALSRAGLRTVLAIRPDIDELEVDADALVIGLKTRSIPVPQALADSLAALETLQRVGASQFYVKYCSTFDSTPAGNIGPVTEALAQALATEVVLTTPAAPIHGRTLYCGHLFVDGVPLHETHMRNHPITPMRDSSVVRLLQPQVAGAVQPLRLTSVREGSASVRRHVQSGDGQGQVRHLVADAIDDSDLDILADAVHDQVLVAGSAGLVGAMARRQARSVTEPAAPPPGRTAIIAGSCSQRTLEQIAQFQASGRPSHQLLAGPGDTAASLTARALTWWEQQPEVSILMYSSTPADRRGAPGAGQLYEQAAGAIAVELARRGVKRLLIAGGETSGEVMAALGTRTAVVGAEAATGAPWIHDAQRDLHLVLKSGNFGSSELFVDVATSGEAM